MLSLRPLTPPSRPDESPNGHAVKPVSQRTVGLVLPEGTEELPYVVDQECWLLHGEEVASSLEVGPVDDVVVSFGESPDGDVVPGYCDARWYRASQLARPGARVVVGLVVQLG
jgi:hypothetical protein